MKITIVLLLTFMAFNNPLKAQEPKVLFWWSFDDSSKTTGKEFSIDVPYGNYQIGGLTKFVPGVKGKAVKFDGFSSFIDVIPKDLADGSTEAKLFNLPSRISVEAWVALGAYPWNWAPVQC